MREYVKGFAFDCDPVFNEVFFRDPFRIDTLAIKRRLEPFAGFYDFVGGGVEHGENVMDAMHRESWEELRIRANWRPYTQKHVFYKDRASRITYFTANVLRGDFVQDSEELIGQPYLWKRAHNIPISEIAFPTNQMVFQCFITDIHESIRRNRHKSDYRNKIREMEEIMHSLVA